MMTDYVGRRVEVIGNLAVPNASTRSSYTFGEQGRIVEIRHPTIVVKLDNNVKFPVSYLYSIYELKFLPEGTKVI